MAVWRVEARAVQAHWRRQLSDVSQQKRVDLEGSACSQASKMCPEQKRGERPTRTPPHPDHARPPRARHHHDLSLCLVTFLAGPKWGPAWPCAWQKQYFPNRPLRNPPVKDHVWETHERPRFIGRFPAKNLLPSERWCHKTSPDALRC